MSAHELDIARQLIALAPLLRGDWYHVHFTVRPALFEAAVGLADLLRPELGEDVHIPLFGGIDEDVRDYKLWLRLDNEVEYNRRHAGCSHTNCCESVARGRNESMRRRAACEYLIDDGQGPGPWDGLTEFRAVRIWHGLARALIKYGSGKTYELEDGTHKAIIDSATQALLRELTEQDAEAPSVEERHPTENERTSRRAAEFKLQLSLVDVLHELGAFREPTSDSKALGRAIVAATEDADRDVLRVVARRVLRR